MEKCRIYTDCHAIKPKPKFKNGAISETTTALNVDQTNTSVLSAEQKNGGTGVVVPLPSPLAPTTNTAAKGSQDQPTNAAPSTVTDTGANGSTTLSTAPMMKNKENVGLPKVNADKKKIDARKKSLKRL